MKTGVKLACKTVFIRFSPLGERTMLLVRRKPDKRCAPAADDFKWVYTVPSENVTKLLKAIAFLF